MSLQHHFQDHFGKYTCGLSTQTTIIHPLFHTQGSILISLQNTLYVGGKRYEIWDHSWNVLNVAAERATNQDNSVPELILEKWEGVLLSQPLPSETKKCDNLKSENALFYSNIIGRWATPLFHYLLIQEPLFLSELYGYLCWIVCSD